MPQHYTLSCYSLFPTYPHKNSQLALFSVVSALLHLPCVSKTVIVQPFLKIDSSILWLLLTSCSSLLLRISPPARPPQLRLVTFLSYIRHIYTAEFGQYWTLLWLASSSALHCLICDFCSSDREFALGLLHTPPHDGRTCPLLTVPTAKSVVDFHHQVTDHSGQTGQEGSILILLPSCLFLFVFICIMFIVNFREQQCK